MTDNRLANLRLVLVETTHPGNIGSAARAMKTMGLSDLRLVAPKQFPHVEATALASGADDLLGRAQVVPTLDDAIGDADFVIATSGRQRHLPWPCVSARDMGQLLAAEAPERRIAILFGREDRGLTNDELQRANLHVTIPSNPAYGVLNVAAAVQVIAYELRMALVGDGLNENKAGTHRFAQPAPSFDWDQPPATQQEQMHLLAHLERVALNSGFIDPAHPDRVIARLRRLFMRARPDHMEANILRGLLATLEKHLPPAP